MHSRPEHSVQYMTWAGDGVWLSVRLSSTLQLYHARTFQHLQDVDIQPYVEKMIGQFFVQIQIRLGMFILLAKEKTGLYFVHISALIIACRRLWIGTGNGIIISVPLTDSKSTLSERFISEQFIPGIPSTESNDQKFSSADYIPYCSMNSAQLSFHGYQDAVKFFVAVPGQPTTSKVLENEQTRIESQASPFGDVLVVSGGDGYMDFRVRNTNEGTNDENRHMSYLIVWHLGSG